MESGSIVAVITEIGHHLKIINIVDEEGIAGSTLSREISKERADAGVGILPAKVKHTTMLAVEHRIVIGITLTVVQVLIPYAAVW